VLILGVAYKSDISDVRESPALKVIELLENAGADVSYHDPHVPSLDGKQSVALEASAYDCVAILTAHSSVDHTQVMREAKVVVDFRNATGDAGRTDPKVWKL
jgi:UDP-N-acetyl-D-glucosamine dehydrogenase